MPNLNEQENSNLYVTSERFERTVGNIYERLNTSEKQLTKEISDLKIQFTQMNAYTQQSLDVQKEMSNDIKCLSQSMTGVTDELKDVKYQVKTHDDLLEDYDKARHEKQKGNIEIFVALIGVSGVLGSAAFGFAQIFFN
ncbi:hypothetical protein NGB74_02405 [Staphylococcus chromogenes]|uniref:hypothetical protein n=1 Tax=Staphylococcus chromogenes TaxID=46126 RepID=UPI002DB9544D|nr:hypothetical protein [Staphylococcus chromogenes]MEB7449861.1 hypothetical protein [Staphylococcus chromogenes]